MPGESTKPKEGAPTIGILLDRIESDYQIEMVAAAQRVASRRGARTVVLPGGSLSHDGKPSAARGFVFNALGTADLDGLLLLGGSLGKYCGTHGFERFAETLPHVPTVVVGLDSSRLSSVAVDNHLGVSRLVDHLVEKHQRRKIVFIEGPHESPEAKTRRQAYLDGVKRHDLKLGEDYLVVGGLGREQGIDAVVVLLEDKRMAPPDVDAIIAVNDEVALGVLEELSRRKILVPHDIAVVGFDDAPNAHAASPPLTTVSQRVYEQGASAMGQLLDRVSGKKELDSTVLAPELVLRSSCGCTLTMQNDSSAGRFTNAPWPESDEAIDAQVLELTQVIGQAARGRIFGDGSWDQMLARSLLGNSPREFLTVLSELAQTVGSGGLEVWHEILTALRLKALTYTFDSRARYAELEDTFQEARLALADIALFFEREHHAVQAMHLRVVTRACLGRAHGGDLGELAVALEEQLPLFGLRHFVISRGPGELLSVVARSDKEPNSPSSVSLGQLGRNGAMRSEPHVVVLPLSAKNRPVGLAALSYPGSDPFLFEHLRDLLGMALGLS